MCVISTAIIISQPFLYLLSLNLENSRILSKDVIRRSSIRLFWIILTFEAKAAERPQKNVTLYTTPTCPWCTTVKNYLRKNRVRYSEVDVASDQAAAQSMVSKSGQQGVPQTEIDGQMVIGFDQKKLNR